MKLIDISGAGRLATKLDSLKERRAEWQKVVLTTSTVAQRLNSNNSSAAVRLPMLDDDTAMHVALVEAIIAEYSKRIAATEIELKELGVEL